MKTYKEAILFVCLEIWFSKTGKQLAWVSFNTASYFAEKISLIFSPDKYILCQKLVYSTLTVFTILEYALKYT